MPITTGIRPWNPPDMTEIEKALVPQTELTARTDAQLADELEARYFAPRDDVRVPIALSVDAVVVDAVGGLIGRLASAAPRS